MATEMDMDPFEGLRVRPHIAYQTAAVAACKRLRLTAEQLDAGVITTLVKTLESIKAAIWDAHYGKGLSIEYVQSVDKEIRESLRPFTQETRDEKAE